MDDVPQHFLFPFTHSMVKNAPLPWYSRGEQMFFTNTGTAEANTHSSTQATAFHRRDMLRLLAAGGILLGTAACSNRREKHGQDNQHVGNSHTAHGVSPELELAWQKGFTQRNGHALLDAMQKDSGTGKSKNLQLHMEKQHVAREGLVPQTSIDIRCVEDRLTLPGCGCVGCLIIAANTGNSSDKNPMRYVSPKEAAQMILHSDMVKTHRDLPMNMNTHSLCGGGAIAAELAGVHMGVTKDDRKRNIDQFVKDWGRQLALELGNLEPKRKISSNHIGSQEFDGPEDGHPAQTLAIPLFEGKYLNPKFPKLPQGMEIDPRVIFDPDTLRMHIIASIGILFDHGAHHDDVPLLVYAFGDEKLVEKYYPNVEGIIENDLPEAQRKKVLRGSAVVAA